MAITAAELVAHVSTSGVDSASAQLGIMGAAVKGIGGIFSQLGSGASLMGFGLSNMGTAGVKSGLAIRDAAVQMGGALWKIAGIATLVGGAVAIGIGVMAVRAAADFQQGLNRLRTGAGDTQDSFASLSKGILAVSVSTGQMTGPLTNAMYLILSSGQRGAQAFDTLRVAAQGAVIEQASVVDVANVVSGAMHNFGTKTFTATDYMNGLIKAVSEGKITLQNLSTSMGPLEPLAHQLGISYADLASAMTTQTNAMIPAARAATSLRFMMQSLEVPTHKAKVAMADFGLDSVKVGEEMKKSLPGALQMIYDAAKKAGPEGSVPFNRAVSDMIGGQRSLSAFLALSGTHMKDFVNNSKGISDAMHKGGTDVQGWTIAQGNFNVQMDRAKAAVQATLITIGTALLPVLTKFLAYIAPIIASFGQWLVSSGLLMGAVHLLVGVITTLVTVISSVASFLQHNALAMAVFKGAMVVLAGIILTLMVAAFVAWAVAAWSAAVATIAATWPILAILAVIVLVVAGIILAIQHWGAIMDWITGKMEQTRIAHEQKMVAMKITADNQTIEMTKKVIANYEKQRAGILQKLKETHDPAERMELTHQLKMLDAAEVMQRKRLDSAEKDKQAQLKKQKELHDQMLEAQKNFAARFLDMVVVWGGNVMSAVGTWTHNVLATILGWCGNVMSAIGTFVHNFLSKIGEWVGGIFSAVGTWTRNVLTTIKNFFGDGLSHLGSFVHDFLSLLGSWKDQAVAKAAQLADGILNWVKSLPGRLASLAGDLIQAGLNIVANIATGIINGIGSFLGNAMSQIGNFISSHLPHSPAKVGPLKDLEYQGNQIMSQIAKGMRGGLPELRTTLQVGLSPLMASGLSSAYASRSSLGTTTIVVQPPDLILDGVRLSRGLMPHITNAIRYSVSSGFGR